MIEDYEKAIEKIEERIVQLQITDKLTKCDKMMLIKLYEEELLDLYAIVRYLRSSTATEVFPDLYKPFSKASPLFLL